MSILENLMNAVTGKSKPQQSENYGIPENDPNHFIFTIPNNYPELVRRYEIIIQNGFYYCYNLDNNLSRISLSNAKKIGSDIVEFSYERGCCSECAKRRGRWFSVSGRNKKYPKLDLNYKCSCFGIEFDSVHEGISEPSHCPKGTDIRTYSNRPVIDDRKRSEIKLYNEYIQSIEYEYIKSLDQEEYNNLLHRLPDIAPKSFGAYRRMKNAKTDNFNKLISKAHDLGFEIVYRDDICFKLD